MWRTLLIICLLPLTAQAVPHLYYASPTGSGTNCQDVANIATPCALQTLIGQSGITVNVGSTVLLRGGTYTGRFASTLTGDISNSITVKSYPGEWAVLDGYVHTTLATTINASDTTITLADASQFIDGNSTVIDVTIDNEVIQLRNKSGNTFTSCLRGRAGGQVAASHSSGVTVFAAGQQVLLVQSGGYVTFRDFEIKDSYSTRAFTDVLLDPQYRRPEGLYLDTPNISAINLIIHDCREGIGFWDAAYGGLAYGDILYNNGFVDPVRGHGHGIYTQNTNAAGKIIKEVVSFNNYATGMKMYGVAGTANHYLVEGVISFNNGSPASYAGNPASLTTTEREPNIFAGTEQVPIDDITVQQSVAYQSPNTIGGGSGNIGYDVTGSTNGLWQDNYFLGGIDNVQVVGWDSLIFRRNYVYSSNTSGTRNNNALIKLQVRTGSLSNYSFSSNTYWDGTFLASGCPGLAGNNRLPFFIDTVDSNCNPGSMGGPLDYASAGGWKAKLTETSSTYTAGDPSATVVAVRPNIYDTSRIDVWIWNPTSTSTVAIPVAGIFNNGDVVAYFPVEAGLAGGFSGATPYQTLIVSSGVVTVSTSGWTVATPTGSSFTPATVAPKFVAGVLYRTALSGIIGGAVMGGPTKIAAGTKIN